MNVDIKRLLAVGIFLFVLPFFAALIFYHTVVGRDGLTNFWSIFFGWQLLFLGVTTIGICVRLIQRKKLRQYALPLLVLVITILFVVVPSSISSSSRRYITGDGGPAGPMFNCLLWEETGLYSTYDSTWRFACDAMSIPSYSKFWIDQRYRADQTDASLTYYITFAADELILLSGLYVSFLLAKRRPES
jgi:hypothetical protein